jgi:hypothetical protein
MLSNNSLVLFATFVVAFVESVIIYNNARLNPKSVLHRHALVHPRFSPWMRLLNCGDEESFLELTGFSFQGFRDLVLLVATEDERLRIRRRGRPRLLDIHSQVGLYLFYVGSTMKAKHLALIFGVLPNTVTATIKKMARRLVLALQHQQAAKIKFPTVEEIQDLCEMVRHREPMIDDVFAFLDGIALPIQCSPDENVQNAFYNGYYGDTMVNNIILFAPTGKIIYAVFNCPGSWHDSTVAEPLKQLVLDLDLIYKICVDQGFPRSGAFYDRFVGPLSKRARRSLSPILRKIILQLHNKYVSLRQSSEWGMRGLQGSFSRLKSRLTSDCRMRYLIIYSILLLSNFRIEYSGLNQIATVFNYHYEQYINIFGYDRIARYYDHDINYND